MFLFCKPPRCMQPFISVSCTNYAVLDVRIFFPLGAQHWIIRNNGETVDNGRKMGNAQSQTLEEKGGHLSLLHPSRKMLRELQELTRIPIRPDPITLKQPEKQNN